MSRKKSYLTVTDQIMRRIMARVDVHGPIPTDPSRTITTGCWLWTGGCFPAGYGSISIQNKTYQVHTLVFSHHKGPIPEGHELDHVCRVRRCCNPIYVEAVTRAENIHRTKRPYCKNGHPFDELNTASVKGKTHQRVCRACSAAKSRRYRIKHGS